MLTPVPLTFAHIDGLKISTDKSTLFSKLEVRIITDAPRNIDARIVNGMFLVHSRVDLPSTFGGEADMTLSCLVRRANHVDIACDTYKYPSINDITREDHGIWRGKCIWTGTGHTEIFYLSFKIRIISDILVEITGRSVVAK